MYFLEWVVKGSRHGRLNMYLHALRCPRMRRRKFHGRYTQIKMSNCVQLIQSKSPDVLLADFMGYKPVTEGESTTFEIYILQATNLALCVEYEYVIRGVSYLGTNDIKGIRGLYNIKVVVICFHFIRRF